MKKELLIIGCLLVLMALISTAAAEVVCTGPEDYTFECHDENPNDCYIARCDSSGSCDQHASTEPNGYPCTGTLNGGECDWDSSDYCDSGSCIDVFATGEECFDTDTDDCYVARCDSSGSCNQYASPETFGRPCMGTLNGRECDWDSSDYCDSGSCIDVFATGEECTDTDSDDCLDARCDSFGSCDQYAMPETPGYPCTGSLNGRECDLDFDDSCDGFGTCEDSFNVGEPCYDETPDDCWDARCSGDGSCYQEDVPEPFGYSCTGSSNFGECDDDSSDSCDDSGSCVDVYDVGAPCTDQTPDDCWNARCFDDGSCEQLGQPEPYGNPCTGSWNGGECDDDGSDYCDGSAPTCIDVFMPDTFTCRPSEGLCDEEEKCTGSTSDCPEDEYSSCVTDSMLCSFDKNPEAAGEQFRLIFTPDNSPGSWKMRASNPGQFYYNVMYSGSGDVTITLPKPFETQGAMPIHFYDDVTFADDCLEPGTEIGNSNALVEWTEGCLVAPAGSNTVTLDSADIPAGTEYINIHLDYGLKGCAGYTKDSSNNAKYYLSPYQMLIPNLHNYIFSDSSGGSGTIQNDNVFKRDPGFAGLVSYAADGTPVPDVNVEIYKPDGKLLATVYTDQDGWYMYQYKFTGKAATFTVKLPDHGQTKSVTLKPNQLVIVDFQL